VLVAHSDVLTWWNGVHESDPPSTPWLTWYTKLVRRGLECADAVVAPSQWMLDTLQQHYNLPKRGYVIFNGRSVQLFRPSRSKTDCVLSVGRVWDEAKQMTLLLARDHCVPVGIAGSIEHPDKSRASWLRLQSHGNFKFWGEQNESELRVLYSGASTYAATSRYEPFGLAPVEAALSRCALIANDIPVFHELWGDSALYFKQNDADSLAEAIRILSGNAALRELFADRAYECARERYDASRMVAEYEQLYGRLCGKGASA
jgi:glycosyltransferase involved in cell wall biosynthesis